MNIWKNSFFVCTHYSHHFSFVLHVNWNLWYHFSEQSSNFFYVNTSTFIQRMQQNEVLSHQPEVFHAQFSKLSAGWRFFFFHVLLEKKTCNKQIKYRQKWVQNTDKIFCQMSLTTNIFGDKSTKHKFLKPLNKFYKLHYNRFDGWHLITLAVTVYVSKL